MSRYTNVKVHITDGQKQKLQNAIQTGGPVSIRLGHEDLNGEDVLALTKSQVTRIAKAYESGKGITVKMSKSQLAHNMKVEGGFLGMLAGLAARALPLLAKSVLPTLGIGALSGLASSGVQKVVGSDGSRAPAVLGNGLYLKKGETDGKALYLGPTSSSGFEAIGDGLYLKKEGGLYEMSESPTGKGLVLGPNSPFKNIPILGWIL